jgi:serine/threonine protein kinase
VYFPPLAESVRALLSHNTQSPSGPAVFSWEELKYALSYLFTDDVSLRRVISSLCSLGYMMNVTWAEYGSVRDGSSTQLRDREYVLSNLNPLSTFLHFLALQSGGEIINGVISTKRISEICSNLLKCDSQPFIEALKQQGIIHHMVKDDSYLIAACLPDDPPPQESRPSKFLWTYRRSYLMRDYTVFPLDALAKCIASLLSWGTFNALWRDGCVVTRNEVSFSLKRKRVQEKIGSLTAWRDGLHLIASSNKEDGFRHATLLFFNLIQNVLSEFFAVQCDDVIPLDNSCDDWCPMNQIVDSFQFGRPAPPSMLGRDVNSVDLIPEFGIEGVRQILREKITFKEQVGEGSAGTIYRAEWRDAKCDAKVSDGASSSCSAAENVCEGDVISVAVKEFRPAQVPLGPYYQMSPSFMAFREYFSMNSLRHPNVVNLHGICLEQFPPLIVKEWMAGTDLYTALTDPHRLLRALEIFSAMFDEWYQVSVTQHRSSSPVDMRLKLRCEIEGMLNAAERMKRPNILDLVNKVVGTADVFWREKSKGTHELYAAAKAEVCVGCACTYDGTVW